MKQVVVLLASQRTGSNALNSILNQMPGMVFHGEAFNPWFIGLRGDYYKTFGLERGKVEPRDADTWAFYDRLIKESKGSHVGFHLFPGHAPAVLERVLDDPSIKKICLRRAELHSYVSLQIARQTDVWLVQDDANAKEKIDQSRTKVDFRPEDFLRYKRELDGFWKTISDKMSKTPSKRFDMWYSELNNSEKIKNLYHFLYDDFMDEIKLKPKIVKQNAGALGSKVNNYDAMVEFAKSHGMARQLD